MLNKIPDLLEYVSQFMTLNVGDIFLMGTPSGVGPVYLCNFEVNLGDKIEGVMS